MTITPLTCAVTLNEMRNEQGSVEKAEDCRCIFCMVPPTIWTIRGRGGQTVGTRPMLHVVERRIGSVVLGPQTREKGLPGRASRRGGAGSSAAPCLLDYP
ncbi:hypothetical protein [Novipirellula herctigrandis]